MANFYSPVILKNQTEFYRFFEQPTVNNHVKIGEILIREGILSRAILDDALRHQRSQKRPYIGLLLLEKGLIDKKALDNSLIQNLQIPYFNSLDNYKPDLELIKHIPAISAKKYRILPIQIIDGNIVIGTTKPLRPDVIQFFQNYCRNTIKEVIISPKHINKWLPNYLHKHQKYSGDRIELICSLGLESRIVVPALFEELNRTIPLNNAACFWIDRYGKIVNHYIKSFDRGNKVASKYISDFVDPPVQPRTREFTCESSSMKGDISFSCQAGDGEFITMIVTSADDSQLIRFNETGVFPNIQFNLETLFSADSIIDYPMVECGPSGMAVVSDGDVKYMCARAKQLLVKKFPMKTEGETLDQTIFREVSRIGDAWIENQKVGSVQIASPQFDIYTELGHLSFRVTMLNSNQSTKPMFHLNIQHSEPIPLIIFRYSRQWALSPKQIKICIYWVSGYSHAEIADMLCISKHTAISHIKSIYESFAVNSRTHLMHSIFFS